MFIEHFLPFRIANWQVISLLSALVFSCTSPDVPNPNIPGWKDKLENIVERISQFENGTALEKTVVSFSKNGFPAF